MADNMRVSEGVPEITEKDKETEEAMGTLLEGLGANPTIDDFAKIEAQAIEMDPTIKSRMNVREKLVAYFEKMLGERVLDHHTENDEIESGEE